MKSLLFSLALLLTLGCGLRAETAPDSATLTKLLQDFLAGAGKNDAAMHDRFWADELVYTSSGGHRMGKAEIMKEVRADGAPKADEPLTVYTAEDIRIQQYGDTAVVAFRLVATIDDKGKQTVNQYLNTGTFLKRNGEWRAVAWQATVLPKKEEEKKKS